jgi:hypothetical protein
LQPMIFGLFKCFFTTSICPAHALPCIGFITEFDRCVNVSYTQFNCSVKVFDDAFEVELFCEALLPALEQCGKRLLSTLVSGCMCLGWGTLWSLCVDPTTDESNWHI